MTRCLAFVVAWAVLAAGEDATAKETDQTYFATLTSMEDLTETVRDSDKVWVVDFANPKAQYFMMASNRLGPRMGLNFGIIEGSWADELVPKRKGIWLYAKAGEDGVMLTKPGPLPSGWRFWLMSKQWCPTWAISFLRSAPVPLLMETEPMMHTDIKVIKENMKELGATWVHERSVMDDDGIREHKFGRWYKAKAETKGEL